MGGRVDYPAAHFFAFEPDGRLLQNPLNSVGYCLVYQV
jgi:hypothetical protein